MAAIQLWKDRENKVLDPVLFSSIANEKAEKIHRDGLDKWGNEKQNSSTQLRRFFDEIARLNAKAQAPDSKWEIILPQVHMVVAKTAYAKGRKLVTESFVDLFGGTIRDQVATKDDLRAFASFFEAFIGFYKSYRRN